MKVWRGFTLTVWVIILTLLAVFAMQYRALHATVLEAGSVKTQITEAGAYEKFRDDVLLERLHAVVTERYPENTLIDKAMLRAVLAETLPREEMQRRVEPAVDALYRWLDSKEPEISFSIDLADKVPLFYRALEVQLGNKVAALPSCGDYRYPPEEAILVDQCLPLYVTAPEATAAAMGALKTAELPIGNTIVPETLAVPKTQTAALKQIPTYLNYLWVLNWVAIILFVLISLLLIAGRRSLGVIAIGVSLLAASLVVWLTVPLVRSLKLPPSEGVMTLISSLTDTLITTMTGASARYALITLLAGLSLIVGAGMWRWWRKHRA